MAEQCQHLNTKERKRFLNLLRKFEDLFDSTLGTWNTTPVDLELMGDTKYPVTRVHEDMFRK